MKKIIAAIDGLKYSESTTQYAIELAKENDGHLVGVLLDDYTYHSYKIYELISNEDMSLEKISGLQQIDKQTRERAAFRFKEACQLAGVNCSLRHDKNFALQELLHESVYADLIIIDGKETLAHYEEKKPTRFIRDLLSQVQCPVLVVADNYTPVDKIVLLYDGEPASVAAIRAFSYVLPSLKKVDTEVLSVKTHKQTLHVPDNRLMKEFMKRHFPDAAYTVLRGLAETEIENYLSKQKKNVLVVLGAYGRSMVSRWFRSSMADLLMQDLNMPLFITHIK